MSSIAISAGAFVLAFGGALLAALLGPRLPRHHLSEQNKEIVRLAMALVGTLAGMALGLLIGSAVRGHRSASKCGAVTLADHCTEHHNDIETAVIRDDFLADEYFRELGLVFASKHNVSNSVFCSGVARFWRSFFDPGNVFALQRVIAREQTS